MEEIAKVIGEQPLNNIELQEDATEAIISGKSSLESGSPYGKFKDADTLFSAYNDLEAEFTRKCQRLSELKKKQNDNVNTSIAEREELTPFYKQENWQEKVADFLNANENAKFYAKEICEEIINNPDDYKTNESLNLAYAKVVKSAFVPPQKLIENEDFIKQFVLNNDDIKSQVLGIYLAEISKGQAPKTIGGVPSSIAVGNTRVPTTLDDAKSILQGMLN